MNVNCIMLFRSYILVVGTYLAAMGSVGSAVAQTYPKNLNLSLNPSPNPLHFPTKIEEFKIEGIQPITLKQALELAQRNNRKLKAALLRLERSKAALQEAKTTKYPTFDLSLDIYRIKFSRSRLLAEELGQQFQLLPTEDFRFFQREPTTIFSPAVTLTYGLYNFEPSGFSGLSKGEAERQLSIDELDVKRISEVIRLNVQTDYYNLQEAGENVRIQRSAVNNSRASLRDAETKERAGIGTRFAVLQARSVLANDIQALNSALAEQTARRSQLAQRLSIPQTVNLAAADPVKLAGLWCKSLEESMILAFQNSPKLQQQLHLPLSDAIITQKQQQQRVKLFPSKPQVNVFFRSNLQDVVGEHDSSGYGYSLGIQLRQKLFDGGVEKAKSNQKKANIAIAENKFAQIREQIRSEVEQAYAQLEPNLKNIQTSNLGLEVAIESLRLARLYFQAGVGTQTDVIREQNALTQAESNRVRAILGYNRALAQLKRVIGLRKHVRTYE